jgi:hypothetical protein
MFILHLISKSFSGVLPRPVGATSIPHQLVTESMFRPATTLKPYPVFRCRQLPYHQVQQCLHRSANCPGTPPCRWDCPSTLRLVDIRSAFPSQSPFCHFDSRHGYHHVNLCVGAYKHPNHKSCSPCSQCYNSCGRQGHRQESSWSRQVCCPHSTSGQCFVRKRRFGTTISVHFTDTCLWCFYDSFDAHSQLRINNTYRCYQTLMHRLSILWSYQSTNSGASRSVTNTMLVWDTGPSIGLTPFRSDFIDYLPLDGVTVKDIARANSVLGIGAIMWKLPTTKGNPVFIPAVAYHMPDCDIRLFSPQSYFNLHEGDATITAWSVVMRLPDNHVVDIPFDTMVNLPVIPHSQPTLEEQDTFGPHLLSLIVANTLHLYGLAKPVCCKTMADVSNNNLSGPQRELIQWHSKLCITMNHVQE